MLKQLFLLLVFLFFGIKLCSQTVTIVNKETNERLEQVTIFDQNTKNYLTTNEKGQADLSNFKNASTLEVRFLGFKTKIKTYAEIKNNRFVIQLEPSILSMDEIVISASKWKQKKSELATKVAVISSKEIQLLNPQTAADLLTISGKVFVQKSQQGGGSPMIRGFATNRLLYTIDGVRMNNAIFRAGNIQNVISLDPFSIEKTEVVFGPGSVIYGSDAIGAVMSFKTITPRFSFDEKKVVNGNAFARFSSANNEKTVHADINVGFQKWAFVTSISHNDYGDLTMGSNGPDEYLRNFYIERIDNQDVVIENKNPKKQIPTGYTQLNFMQKIGFKSDDNWDFEYGFHFSETSSYDRYDRLIITRNGLPRDGEWKYGPQKWLMNNLEIDKNMAHSFFDNVSLRITHQNFEESRISRGFNRNGRETRTEKVAAFSSNLDFTKVLSKRNKLFYGTEYVFNDVTSTGVNTDISTNTSQKGSSRYPNATWSSLGFYVSNQTDFATKWTLQTGLRYNFYTLDAIFDTTFYPFPFTEAKIDDAAFSGSIGLVFRPDKTWLLSTNMSSAFRSPNVDDIGKVFDSEPGFVVVPNPTLKAEYAYNTDISIAKTLTDFIKIELTGFYTVLKNAMVRRNFTLNGLSEIMYDGEMSQVQAIQNAASAHVYGFQTGVEIDFGKGFGFSSDFNYQKGEEELDNGEKDPLRHATPWFGTTRISYSKNKINAQFYANYSGSVAFENMPETEIAKPFIYAIDQNGNPYSPSWFILNVKTSYQFKENLLFSSGIENLTDVRYRPYNSGIVSPGRNFVISLKATI
jgi:hemoglobin/transferrin/lactoferrin receptor protein